MLIVRPYYLKSQNVLLVICLAIGILFTALLIAEQYISISDSYMSYAVAAMEGLLVLVNILAFARLYIHSKHNERAFKILHE
jgi:hypothetical protein